MVVPGALVKLSSLRTRRFNFKLSTLVGVTDIQIPPDAPAAYFSGLIYTRKDSVIVH